MLPLRSTLANKRLNDSDLRIYLRWTVTSNSESNITAAD